MYMYILLHSTCTCTYCYIVHSTCTYCYILNVLIIDILYLQAIQDIILKGHRQAFVWIDEWHGMF